VQHPLSRSSSRPSSNGNSTATVADFRAWYYLTNSSHRSNAISSNSSTVFIVDDDISVCERLRGILEDHGYAAECFSDGQQFLRAYRSGREGCLLIDAEMPGMNGMALLRQVTANGIALPIIMTSANPAFHVAVQAMKAGAVDFIEKPFSSELLLATVATALKQAEAVVHRMDYRKDAIRRISSLTNRQHEILDLVVAGHPTKNIAADLHISARTVDNHRAAIARKTCSESLPALIQTAVCAKCSIHAQQQHLSPRASFDDRGADVLH
jgi:two-component system CheB/CheR fusion protein